MKRIVALFLFFIILFITIPSAFSFDIDGVDSGVEWDGATVYKLIDGESNCGVSYALVKVKFDHETSALCLCFQFIDSNLLPDNINAGISISLENISPFEITAHDSKRSENITPYSFDGAIHIDKLHGATCEVRIGIKSGLPQSVCCNVRFIDSDGCYSNEYDFTVENEEYITPESSVISPTADNTDPVFNHDYDELNSNSTMKNSYSKKTTTKRYTTKHVTKPSTTDFVIKTSPPYSYTGRKITNKNKTELSSVMITGKQPKTNKSTEKIYIYEKEVYISEVYITENVLSTLLHLSDTFSLSISISEADLSDNNINYSMTSENEVTLSKGTKYKKIISGVSFAAFIILACFGVYSAKKNKNLGADNDKKTED